MAPGAAPATADGHDLLRAAAIAFAEADVDGSGKLDFTEFKRVIPAHMRAASSVTGSLSADDASLHQLFTMADADGSGYVSHAEFFFWSMACATDHAGVSLRAAFETFDTTGDGGTRTLYGYASRVLRRSARVASISRLL